MVPSTKPRTYFPAQVPTSDTPCRFFLPSTGSRGTRFPGFIGTMRVLRLPAAHLAALRFLRLAVPRLHSLFSLLCGRVRRRGQELVTRWLRPGISEETTGSPKFLGNLDCPFAHVLTDAGRTACTRPLRCSSVALGPPSAKAPTIGLSTLNSTAFGLAVYASQGGLLRPTQDSLPVAGQALLDGLFTRKVPMKGFRVVVYISSSSPKLAWRNRSYRRAFGRADRSQYSCLNMGPAGARAEVLL